MAQSQTEMEQLASGSQIEITIETTEQTTVAQAPVLKLRLQRPQTNRRVSWSEDTIDNENMNKRKSKCCCIYRKPYAFGESSSSDDEECEHCFGHPEKRRRNRKPVVKNQNSNETEMPENLQQQQNEPSEEGKKENTEPEVTNPPMEGNIPAEIAENQ